MSGRYVTGFAEGERGHDVTQLTGVVQPPEDDELGLVDLAANTVTEVLEACRERLRLARAEKETLRVEIKTLDAQERVLARMARAVEGRQRG